MQSTADPNENGRGKRRALIWALASLSLLLLVALAGVVVVGSKPCASCHFGAEFRRATAASAHNEVACETCHVAPGPLGEFAFYVRRPLHTVYRIEGSAVRDASSVGNDRCLECHTKDIKGPIDVNGVSIDHSTCAKGRQCTDCHSATAHGEATAWVRAYDMETCVTCHSASKKDSCKLCHKGRHKKARVRSASFSVTHGANWKSTHGMGDVATCTICHKSRDCKKCHGSGVPHVGEFVTVHAKYAKRKSAKCFTCHDETTFCTRCHGTPMPHSVDFKRTHAKPGKEDREQCDRCHAQSDCEACHTKHVHPGGAVSALKPVVSGGGQ